MSDINNDSEKYDLFDELESGSTISQETLDSLRSENPELFEVIQKSNLLRNAEKVKPDPFYSRVSQIRVFYQLSESINPKPKLIDQIKFFVSNLRYPELPSLSPKPVFTVLIALVLSFSVFIGGAQAADNARPGQFLYPVDRALEDIQIFLTFNEQNRIKLHLAIAAERLEEAQTAYLEDDYEHAEIALAGYEEIQLSIRSQIENNQIEITEDLLNNAVESYKMNRAVLNNLLTLVPEESQASIKQAIEISNDAQSQHFTVQQPSLTQPTSTLPAVVEETITEEDLGGGTPTISGGVGGTSIPGEAESTEVLTPQPSLVIVDPVFITVWVHSVNVRSGPGLDEPIIDWLSEDQTFFVDSCENGFVYIPEFSGWAAGTCFEPNPCGLPGSCLDASD